MIDGSTRKVGVMGWPVSHTLSPLMHNAAFAALGLNYVYLPFAVKPEELEKAVAGIKALGFAGMNVTIPHKVAVMAYLDDIDEDARLIGAVNTIAVRQGKLIGSNTDAAGFMASLASAGVYPKGKQALLLGAGGAARAVVCGLAMGGSKSITVAAREVNKAILFAQECGRFAFVEPLALDSSRYLEALRQADIIINCTPLGMKPNIDDIPLVLWKFVKPDAVICDLVYNPVETRLLKEAKEQGLKVVGGVGMLVEQGAIAFETWTGAAAPRETMTKAIIDKL